MDGLIFAKEISWEGVSPMRPEEYPLPESDQPAPRREALTHVRTPALQGGELHFRCFTAKDMLGRF